MSQANLSRFLSFKVLNLCKLKLGEFLSLELLARKLRVFIEREAPARWGNLTGPSINITS